MGDEQMTAVSANDLAFVLRAIAEAGGPTLSPTHLGDSWSAPSAGGRQLFLEARDPETLARGEPYVTWVVDLDAEGRVIHVDSFTSVTCRVGRKRAD